jgi:hypothetical protein
MTATDVRPDPDAEVTAAAVAAALRVIDANLSEFGDRYPGDTTVHNRYELLPAGINKGWTTSFWPAMLWLAHDLTGDDAYRLAAARHVRSFTSRLHDGADIDTHDLGFLYTLACAVLIGKIRSRPTQEWGQAHGPGFRRRLGFRHDFAPRYSIPFSTRGCGGGRTVQCGRRPHDRRPTTIGAWLGVRGRAGV